MTIKEMWKSTMLTKTAFAELLEIPYSTMTRWFNKNDYCPPYTAKLIEYYLRNEGYLRR